MSRIAAPATWPIERKKTKWIAKPVPGPHSLMYSMPLIVIVRDILKLGETEKDVKNILNQDQIKVNNVAVNEIRFPVGLFDVISIVPTKKLYRVSISALGRLTLIEISAKEEHLLPLKIVGKKALKKNKVQVNLSNGWNILSDSKDYKIGDVVLVNPKDKKVVKHISLKEGSSAFVVAGKHSGKVVKYEGCEIMGLLRKKKIATISVGSEKFKTSVENLFAIGEKNPEVTVI